MKLSCPQNQEHRSFLRRSYDPQGREVNVEILDQFGRFFSGDQLDLYTGDVCYRFFCAVCGAPAIEEDFS